MDGRRGSGLVKGQDNEGEKGSMITSVTKGTYGQWIVTAELNGRFVSHQFYQCLKLEAIRWAKELIHNGTFDTRGEA